jgi:hypothetical protein
MLWLRQLARHGNHFHHRAIAGRVSGDPVSEAGKNGLFYTHSDHLGSNSVMS